MRALRETPNRISIVALQGYFTTQNIVAQFRPFEQQVFEGVVNQFGRCILIGVNLIVNHLLLALQFMVGKGRREGNIGQEFDGLGKITAQHGRMNRRVLFRGKGIQLAPQILQPAVDLPCFAPFGPFEEGVLGEVCQAIFRGELIACAGINHQCTMSHRPRCLAVDATNAVGKCIGCKFNHGIRWFRSLR